MLNLRERPDIFYNINMKDEKNNMNKDVDGNKNNKKMYIISSLLLLAFYHSLVHISAVVALGAGAISFVHIVKSAEPAVTAILCNIIYAYNRNNNNSIGNKISMQKFLSLIPIILGVSIASLKELNFTYTAFIDAMLSNIESSMRSIETKKLLLYLKENNIGKNITSANLYAIITILSSIMLLPFTLIEKDRWMSSLLGHKGVQKIEYGEDNIKAYINEWHILLYV